MYKSSAYTHWHVQSPFSCVCRVGTSTPKLLAVSLSLCCPDWILHSPPGQTVHSSSPGLPAPTCWGALLGFPGWQLKGKKWVDFLFLLGECCFVGRISESLLWFFFFFFFNALGKWNLYRLLTIFIISDTPGFNDKFINLRYSHCPLAQIAA